MDTCTSACFPIGCQIFDRVVWIPDTPVVTPCTLPNIEGRCQWVSLSCRALESGGSAARGLPGVNLTVWSETKATLLFQTWCRSPCWLPHKRIESCSMMYLGLVLMTQSKEGTTSKISKVQVVRYRLFELESCQDYFNITRQEELGTHQNCTLCQQKMYIYVIDVMYRPW